MVNYYDLDYVCESTDVVLSEYNILMKQWNRLDSIFCLENTNSEKEGIADKVIKLIVGIIKETKNMVNKFISSITNKTRYMLMSQKEKDSFALFKRYVREHPDIKKKEVTVKDWVDVKKRYANIESELDKMYNDPTIDYNYLSNKGSALIQSARNISSKAASAITIDACLKMAEQSTNVAKDIQTELYANSKVLDRIEEDLGKKETKKFQKKLNKLTKESTYRKLKVALLGQKEKDFWGCLNDYIKSFEDFAEDPTDTKNIIKTGVQHHYLAKTVAKNYLSDQETRKDIDNVYGAIKTAHNIKKGIKNVLHP